jgi:membrane associated rhomboid family serine protease/Zn-finger nucleic acid-binding protein
MLCPRCSRPLRPALEDTPSGRVEVDYCPVCRGIWFDHGELEALLSRVQSGALAFSDTAAETLRRCPRHPGLALRERGLVPQSHGRALLGEFGMAAVHVDQCPDCRGLWLDGGELQQLAAAMVRAPGHPLLRPPVPPAVVAASRAPVEEEAAAEATPPTSAWLWLFMFMTGLPVEHDHPRRRWPVMVTVLIALCVLGFLGTIGSDRPERVAHALGLIPLQALAGRWIPFVTHMFLHGSLMHLFGNMYFLWVFGDNVEDRLGGARFLLLYGLSGLGAAAMQIALTPDPSVPMVGASGAISGVMAAYAVLFPKARLVSLIFIFRVHWKTSTYLLFWFGFQLFGALSESSGVAWWAHIGGFIVGGVLGWYWRPSVPTNPTPTWPPVRGELPGAPTRPKLEWS